MGRRQDGGTSRRLRHRRRRSRLVRTPAQAAAAQAEFGGPVAVKIAAAIHKSDVGGVALGIDSPHAAAEAVTAIRAILTEAGIAEHAGEFLIQEQVRGTASK